MSGAINGIRFGKAVSDTTPSIAGIRLMTSVQGAPIPIVYGTMRVAGHLIDYDDFREVKGTAARTGGMSGTPAAPGAPTYTCLVIIAICEGPVVDSPAFGTPMITLIYADKDRVGLTAYGGFDAFHGAIGQAVWAYMTTAHPTKALPYSGTAYVAAAQLDLEGVASLKNFSFQMQGFCIAGPADASGYFDADPALIVVDFLTNVYYGAGWATGAIAPLNVGQDGTIASSYARYCLAAGFYMSPVIDQQRPAADYLQALLVATNSAAVFSGGLLKIIPYGDQAITGNGVTFTPYVTPQYDLTVDHFLPSMRGDDVITVTRAPLADTFNCIPVEYCPRLGLQYNPAILQDVDPLDGDRYGTRQGQTLPLHGITQASHALQISRIHAQRSVYIRNRYSFRLPYRYILLEPMDLVTLTEAKLGLSAKVVRIVSIEEDAEGTLAVEAEEWPFGVATGTLYTTEENDGTIPDTSVAPGDAAAPALFDLPALFGALGVPTVGIATAGGDDWGGAQVWFSWDDVTYELAGMITKKATYGIVDTGGYATGTGFDVTHTLPVDLAISGQPLASVTDQQATDLLQPAMVGSEMVSFATATLTGTDLYNITRVQRGIYGTAPSSHAAGQNFVLMDDAVFRLPVPLSRLGTTLYVKLVSVNQYGAGLQDIATLTASTHTVAGTDPPYPASVTLALATGRPTPAATTMRAKLHELHGNVKVDDLSTVSPVLESPRYATVTWPTLAVNPAELLVGFEVVIYTGSDPDAVSVYQVPKAVVPAKALGYQVTLPSGTDLTSTTLVAAVRPLYAQPPEAPARLKSSSYAGPWRTSTGQTVGTVTYPLNVPISIKITQTGQNRTTVTFTVVLTDPYGQIVSATTLIAFAGLTGLTLNGSAAPASYTATYGSPDTFVATLDPAFNGAGYVRIGAVISGRADSYAVITFHEQNQDAAPTLTMTVQQDGTPQEVLNGNDNTLSWIWLGQTGSMPSDATVRSTGTTTNGRVLTITHGTVLALGDRWYFKGIPYTAASAGGLEGTIVSGTVDYQNQVASKHLILMGSDFNPVDPTYTSWSLGMKGDKGITSNSATKYGYFEAPISLPVGAVLTGATLRSYLKNGNGAISAYIYKIDSTGNNNPLGSAGPSGTGWLSTAFSSITETVDSSVYKAWLFIDNTTATNPDDDWVLSIDIAYDAATYIISR